MSAAPAAGQPPACRRAELSPDPAARGRACAAGVAAPARKWDARAGV